MENTTATTSRTDSGATLDRGATALILGVAAMMWFGWSAGSVIDRVPSRYRRDMIAATAAVSTPVTMPPPRGCPAVASSPPTGSPALMTRAI